MRGIMVFPFCFFLWAACFCDLFMCCLIITSIILEHCFLTWGPWTPEGFVTWVLGVHIGFELNREFTFPGIFHSLWIQPVKVNCEFRSQPSCAGAIIICYCERSRAVTTHSLHQPVKNYRLTVHTFKSITGRDFLLNSSFEEYFLPIKVQQVTFSKTFN